MADQIGLDNPQDTAFVREQYGTSAAVSDLQFPIVPTNAIVSINGAVGPTVTLSGGTTGLSFAVGGTTISLTGVLIPANGGTGLSSYAIGDLVYASATTTLAKLADVTTGNALISGGVGVAPSYGKIGLTTHVSGVLPIANGGVDQSAWQSWTPTWTNLSVGNGTVTAKYVQIGKSVFARLTLVFGTTTSVTGGVSFTLPVTSVSYAGTASIQSLGVGAGYDSGALIYSFVPIWLSTTLVGVVVLNASGTYVTQSAFMDAAVPFVWGTSDELYVEFSFEAA